MDIGWTEVVIILLLLLATSGIFRRIIRQTYRAIMEAYAGRENSSNNNGQSSTAGPRNYHRQKQHPTDGPGYPFREQEQPDPYKILKIHKTATRAEITSAYRKLAQLYHPDKVAGLAPEFTEIAERNMKNINAAYQTLKNKPAE